MLYPTNDEVLEHGTEEDKAGVLWRKKFLERVKAAELKDPSHLPEIDSDDIVITVEELPRNDEDGDAYIILLWNGTEIWREIRTYEYCERFIEIGDMLKKRYGSRLKDFVPCKGPYMYGDYGSSSFDEVKKFREALRMSND
jgi:hypothetical protein